MSWFSTPPTAEGACLCCLTWIWMWGAGVGFTPLILNLLGASDTCKLEWNRDLGHSCVFLPVYFTCELPPPYPATHNHILKELHSILILLGCYGTPGCLPVLAKKIVLGFWVLLFLWYDVYIVYDCAHSPLKNPFKKLQPFLLAVLSVFKIVTGHDSYYCLAIPNFLGNSGVLYSLKRKKKRSFSYHIHFFTFRSRLTVLI